MTAPTELRDEYKVHWADFTADRIIKQLGDKEKYVLASGITPSGTVHFGNFREVITVDLVAKALRSRGKEVRFIFSWDDYDTFRKIPKNMPKQAELEKYMFQPIVDTPDPYEKHESYAAHHENSFMEQLKKVGVEAEPLFQAKKYRAGEYNHAMIKTLKHAKEIKTILDAHRSEPLAENWLPISIYCSHCNRDKMKSIAFDGESKLRYECELCQHKGEEDLKQKNNKCKLPWRMDWPMRWAYEEVDFEPGGKDHSSKGGSFSTGKEIVAKIYEWKPPIYLQYDFVSIKGAGGKMSSSSGNLITVNDVLEVYSPQMIRWIFASYKTNVDFSVSFDLDVLKSYEDFDKMERLAYDVEEASDKKRNMAKRVYQLSSVRPIASEMPFQPSFRHLCNILQINDGDIKKSHAYYADQIKTDADETRFQERAERAWYWVNNYAPEDFKFQIHKDPIAIDCEQGAESFLSDLSTLLSDNWDSFQTDKDLHEKMYEIIHKYELKPQEAFPPLYKKLIGKEKGPKLASFLLTIGKERVLHLLRS